MKYTHLIAALCLMQGSSARRWNPSKRRKAASKRAKSHSRHHLLRDKDWRFLVARRISGDESSSSDESSATVFVDCNSVCANQGTLVSKVVACYDMMSAAATPVSSTGHDCGTSSSEDSDSEDRRLMPLAAPNLIANAPGFFTGTGEYFFLCENVFHENLGAPCIHEDCGHPECCDDCCGNSGDTCTEGVCLNPQPCTCSYNRQGGLIVPASAFSDPTTYSFYMKISRLNNFMDYNWWLKVAGFDDASDDGVYIKSAKSEHRECRKHLEFYPNDVATGEIEYYHASACTCADPPDSATCNARLVDYSFFLLFTRDSNGVFTSYVKYNLTDSWTTVYSFSDAESLMAAPVANCTQTNGPCFSLFMDDWHTNGEECTYEGGYIDFIVLYDGAVDPALV